MNNIERIEPVLAVMDAMRGVMNGDASQDAATVYAASLQASAALAELIERGKELQRKAGAHEWKAFAAALARVQGDAL